MNTKSSFVQERTIDPVADPNPASSISPVFDGELARSARGRFVPGASGNPHGRPRGSLNKSTLFARLLTETNITNVTNKAIQTALAGNPAALKICMARLLPVPKDVPVTFDLPQTGDVPTDLLAAHDHLIRQMAAGEITPKQAQSVSRILEARLRCWESVSSAHRNGAADRREEGETGKEEAVKQTQGGSRAE